MTGCLLDFAYFEKNYRLIAVDLGKQKHADPRAIQQIIFTGKASGDIVIYYILKQSKETILKFYHYHHHSHSHYHYDDHHYYYYYYY